MVVFWVKETRSSFEKGRGAGDLRTEGSFGIAAYKFKIETTNMFVCLSPRPRNSGEFDLTRNAIYHSVYHEARKARESKVYESDR